MVEKTRYSYLSHLECSRCGVVFDPDRVQRFCPSCMAPLLASYDMKSVKEQFNRDQFAYRPRGMWRWHELLPVMDSSHVITLGEGDTPILTLTQLGGELGLPNLFMKDESLNPTGTFKARGLSSAISKVKELGLKKVIIPTAGNAGGAMALYASRAEMHACVVMPKDTPLAAQLECQIAGAQIILVDGLISDAARIAGSKAEEESWFDVSTFKEPYRLEGKKVMGFEIAEAFQWNLPDVIIYPTGGGTGLVGIWKALQELISLGWLASQHLPRMIAIQAEGCAPVVKALDQGHEVCEFWPGAETIAAGLRVPKSFADRLILKTIRQSGGGALAVSDDAILEAGRKLASKEGIFAAPEGSATLAGLFALLQRGLIHPDERVLLINTGSGLKYLDTIFSSPKTIL